MAKSKEHRAIKNILHNELGITKIETEKLLIEHVERVAEKKLADYMKTNAFDSLINSRVKAIVTPIIQEIVKQKMQWGKIEVNVDIK